MGKVSEVTEEGMGMVNRIELTGRSLALVIVIKGQNHHHSGLILMHFIITFCLPVTFFITFVQMRVSVYCLPFVFLRPLTLLLCHYVALSSLWF
jgi:hypothetical protein